MVAAFANNVARCTGLALLVGLLSFLPGCWSKASTNVVEWHGPTMGTEWRISFGLQNHDLRELNNPQSSKHKSLHQSIVRELERINQLMSTWDPASELSLFNANRSTEPVSWHTDSLTVLQAALAVSAATDGAYDVTRGKVFDLWGFGANVAEAKAPSEAQLHKALSLSGYQSISVSATEVSKLHGELSIDLSSLAKGFAVDRLGEVLESAGIQHYVVNIGGEIRVRGERSQNSAWRIGVEQPDATVAYGLALDDAHLATSGSYRNVRVVDGQRVSHLIDGRTGEPIAHNLVAATVLHESTLWADAWATAYMVLGAEPAQTHAIEHELAVQLTTLNTLPQGTSEPLEFTVWQSPKWLELPSVAVQ